MKSPIDLFQCILADAEMWCCTSTTLDLKTIKRRFEDEGYSFLTITLPSFCSEFERALDQGMVTHGMFRSFRKHAALPRFLGGLLERIFDRTSGLLLDDADHTCIFFVRQITLLCKKLLHNCSEERERKAYERFIECEQEVANWSTLASERDFSRFDRVCSLLWSSDFSIMDHMVLNANLRPKHGPGKTADRILGNEKYDFRSWHRRLEENYFPSADHIIPNFGYFDLLQSIDFLEPEAEMPVRVISVPKTLKTPRIIAIEPTCMQYAQQALMEMFVDRLEKSDTLQGSIGFTDQTPNQRMARLGSDDGSLATIDLSEASDRVPNLLVSRMFMHFPHLRDAVQACRSTKADVPGHGVIPLTKFASMGSAVCFPIEAMVFLTIVLCGIDGQLNRQLTNRDLRVLLGKVRVYGDDIIVPVEYVRSVVSSLEDFGLKVNERKSFWTGKFRESCGKDYYGGSDVTVTYFRRDWPTHRSDGSGMSSAISFRNQLYKAGLWKTVEFLDECWRRLAPLPCVLETSPALGRHSFLGYDTERVCDTLHRPLVKALVVHSTIPKSSISGEGALLKYFLKRGSDPFADKKHLERYGRPLAVDTKLRWASAT